MKLVHEHVHPMQSICLQRITALNTPSQFLMNTVIPRYTVPLDIPCTVFFPQIACLAVFTRKTYLDIPCTSIYRAFSVSPKKHGISRNNKGGFVPAEIFSDFQYFLEFWIKNYFNKFHISKASYSTAQLLFRLLETRHCIINRLYRKG